MPFSFDLWVWWGTNVDVSPGDELYSGTSVSDHLNRPVGRFNAVTRECPDRPLNARNTKVVRYSGHLDNP